MSTYCECRFKNIVMDLSTRPDIVEWLTDVKKYLNDENEEIKSIPNEIKECFLVHDLHNEFTSNFHYDIILEDKYNVLLNILIGNKDRNYDIEHLIHMLAPYVIKGNIYLDKEYGVINVDIDKTIKECNLGIICGKPVPESEDGFYKEMISEDL